MNRTKIIREDIDVPVDILIETTDMLLEAGINPILSATDEEEDAVTLGVEYDPEYRQVIHDVSDHIDDYKDADD